MAKIIGEPPDSYAAKCPHCGVALSGHPNDCRDYTRTPDEEEIGRLADMVRGRIDPEEFRQFVIERAITPVDLYGNSIDVVLTADLVELYESVTGRPFYRKPEYEVPDVCPSCNGQGVTPQLLPSGADIPTCVVCKGSGLDPAAPNG